MDKVYLFTLDSHDWFGPFESREQAHTWARQTAKGSYRLTGAPDAWAIVYKPHNPQA